MAKRRRLTKISVSTIVTGSSSVVIPDHTSSERDVNVTQESSPENEIDGSSQVDEDSTEVSERHRGPTILADIWNQSPDEKVVVTLNRYGQPTGEEAGILASFLGTIGRNPELAPQGYSDWRLVPKPYKTICMNEIKLRFSFSRKGEKHILQSLGKRVNDFRGELKAEYYEPYKHGRNYLLNNRPARVPNDQWLDLLTYWNNEKTKKRANTNRNNQKNLKMPHCAGRKSFARYRAEQTVNGVEPSRAKVFIDTHKDRKTKDKKKIDEESAQAVELMKKKMDELPNGIEQNDGQIAWKRDIFDQVIKKPERYGKVRGVGLHVCPSILWGQCSSNQSAIDMLNDDTSNEEIEKLIEHRVKTESFRGKYVTTNCPSNRKSRR